MTTRTRQCQQGIQHTVLLVSGYVLFAGGIRFARGIRIDAFDAQSARLLACIGDVSGLTFKVCSTRYGGRTVIGSDRGFGDRLAIGDGGT